MVIADFACLHKKVVSVPIYFTLTVDDCTSIVENGNVTTVICSSDLVQRLISVSEKCSTLKAIIEMGRKNEPQDAVKIVNINTVTQSERSIHIYSFDYIENQDLDKPNLKKLILLEKENDLINLIYTSNSTGNPKGVMIPDPAWNFNLKSSVREDPDVIFSFCPLAHMTDRKHAYTHICNESMIAIFQGKLEKIFEHIQTVRPTILVSTPRLYNILYGKYQKQLAIATEDLNPNLENYQDHYKTIDINLLKEFKQMLGDRLKVIVTGGAATSVDVLKFLKSCYQCIVSNGFGISETGSIANDGSLRSGVEYKLVDVPEMNYFTTDKPYLRGELCIKSPEMYLGYFNNEELTNIALDNQGFYHTGDIVQQKGDKKVEIIDRIKYIFKQAQ
jgi:long-subunit acyl-CoA synthetase (AMP-forming)